ncbi:hypothetical protein Q7P37_005547 [Cladosporium fusiforme]
MHIHRFNIIALALASAQAAVLPRQDPTTSPITSLPNTSATKKSFLTSITSLPMPSSVEGNTAYPPSTTITEAVSTQVYTPVVTTTSFRPPFTWNASANTTASISNATSSTGPALTTGISGSAANVTTSGVNSTIASSQAPFANSTMSSSRATGAGVAATGTAVQVTGISAANATASSSVRYANSTTAAPTSSTSMLVQMYLSVPTTTLNKNEASTSEIDLGSNMTLVVSDEPSGSSAQATLEATSRGTVATFANSTQASGVAHATGSSLISSVSGAVASSTQHFSNSTMMSGTAKATAIPSSNSTRPAGSSDASGFSTRTKDAKAPLGTGQTSAASSNATSSSSGSLSTGTSSATVANAVNSNGTMFAVTYGNKNNTIVRLIPASNSTNPLGATGTAPAAASTGTASADLGRRDVPVPTAAPITPASSDKKSWSEGFPGFAYARTESLPRPSRFFSGDGWSWSRRS